MNVYVIQQQNEMASGEFSVHIEIFATEALRDAMMDRYADEMIDEGYVYLEDADIFIDENDNIISFHLSEHEVIKED